MRRRKGLPINGVVLLNKPSGLSSNAALQRVRRALGAAKAGHTGTLDPLASGLLPIALGEATKFCQYLLDADKVYLADVRLGLTTDTGDAEGRPLELSDHRPDPGEIEAACRQLTGEIDQIPPMYSALKRDGTALYTYARAGIEVERAPRRVYIHALDVVAAETARVVLRVRCSKGTYIRTLAEDLGRTLGCGAHLDGLVREATGPFVLSDAVDLAQIEAHPADTLARLLPVDAFIAHLPTVSVEDADAALLVRGQPARVTTAEADGTLCRLYAHGQFLGLGQVKAGGVLAPLRMLAMQAPPLA